MIRKIINALAIAAFALASSPAVAGPPVVSSAPFQGVLSSDPSAPPAGAVAIGVSNQAGYPLLSMVPPSGIEKYAMPLWGHVKFGYWLGLPNYSGLVTGGVISTAANFTLSNNTGYSYNSTNFTSRQAATAFTFLTTIGTLAGIYPSGTAGLPFYIGNGSGLGGFFAQFRWNAADAISGARMFVGLSNSTSVFTNVNPNTLTNSIGAAQVDGSANVNIVFGGGTAQTAIDLGSNFPVATNNTDLYELTLWSDPNNNGQIQYQVKRYNSSPVAAFTASGTITNTTPGTTLPSTTTALGPRIWRTNNLTNTAGGININSVVIWSDS